MWGDMREFQINGKLFSDETTPYLIAEVGHNHQGSLSRAIELIQAAAEAGASAVKFQKRDNRSLFTKTAFDSKYDSENAFGETYGAHREALEFGKSEYLECAKVAKDFGVDFFSTAFDFKSADFLADLDMPAYKIASGDLKSIQLIEYVAKIGKPVILSTGGGEMSDIRRAVEAVLKHNKNLALLQCTAGYPPEYSELNLRVIETFRKEFPEVTIGYSGHDSGIAMSLVAYVLGARVIEKHFTLNRALKGTDHAFSLEPVGMHKLVRDLGRTRIALGDGNKFAYPSESAPLKKMGKSIYFAKDLPKGHRLTSSDIVFKSPAIGMFPYQADEILSKVLITDVKQDDVLNLNNFQDES